MGKWVQIRCRVAACREALNDLNQWSFCLSNDSDAPLDPAGLHEISCGWGDLGSSKTPDLGIPGLAPGSHALVWRDDGSGAELRRDLTALVRGRDREVRLSFEFPKLYLKRDLPLVNGLGKPGWQETAAGRPG
jgi:hypothetical protein